MNTSSAVGGRPRAIELQTLAATTARRRGLPRAVRRCAGPLALLLAWQLASSTGWLPAEVLAGPGRVMHAAGQSWASGELPAAMAVSLRRAMLGLLIGGGVGTALAIVSGLLRLGEDLVDSSMQMLRTIPIVALVPLLIIWFGIGEAPKVALIALATAFPLYLNVYSGIRNADQNLVEAGRTLDLSRLGLIRHVILPNALPSALVGLRHALGVSWLALVFSEQINATAGIGYLMNNAREMFQTDVIVVCLVVYALLGLAVDAVVRGLERALLAWRPSFNGA